MQDKQMPDDTRKRKRSRAYEEQQAAIAMLGQHALAGAGVSALFDEAVRLIAKNLRVDYSKVLEFLPDGGALLLRSGVGWKEGLVGAATVGSGKDSQAGYTLFSDRPVVVKDMRTETRFKGPPLLMEHGVVSGMSVVIRGRGRPFGVLGAHTKSLRSFSADDVNFLQSVANILGEAVEHARAEEDLKRRVGELERLQKAAIQREFAMKELKDRLKALEEKMEEYEREKQRAA